MNPNTDLQDSAYLRRKRPQKNSKRNARTECRRSGRGWGGALQRPVPVPAERSKDSVVAAVTYGDGAGFS